MEMPDHRSLGEQAFDALMDKVESRRISDTMAIVSALRLVFDQLEVIGTACDRTAQLEAEVVAIRQAAETMLDRTTPDPTKTPRL